MALSSQGLQSFLDPPSQLEPRVLRIRLAAPDPEPDNAARSGFSFLQSMTENETLAKEVYVPPTMKRSASSLSKQSLEMCTESLGSETGTDEHGNNSDDEMTFISPAPVSNNWSERVEERRRTRRSSRRRNMVLPPPLTSIGSSGGVQMRSRREDGRLVLTAVSVSSCRANFQAERSDGRLRLRLTTAAADCPTQEEEEEEEEEKEAEEKTEEEEEEKEKVEMGSRGGGRCMETGDDKNRGLLKQWEPLWVAT